MKKPNQQKQLEMLATNELPEPLRNRLHAVRTAINDLKEEAAANWDVKREFSPDGRFLGDVGELIAKLFFGVELNVKQAKGHDAMEAKVEGEAREGGRKIEVKLRSKSTIIDFNGKPDIILVIYVSPDTLRWGVVCNGPGKDLLSEIKPAGDLFKTDCFKLMKRQNAIGDIEPRLTQIQPRRN